MRAGALVCRSYYSLLRCAVSPARLVRRVRECGYTSVALADVNGLYGLAEFARCAAEEGVQPIAAAEVLTRDQRIFLLAENRYGYRNLCRILTARHLDPQFDLVDAVGQRSTGLIGICPQLSVYEQLQDALPKDSLFLAGRDIACCDFTLLDEDDRLTTRMLARIRQLSVSGCGPSDQAEPTPMMPEKEFQVRFSSEAVRNNVEVCRRCEFDILPGRLYLPRIKLPADTDSDRRLAQLCHLGLVRRYSLVKQDILRRLERELEVIRSNRFSDYFLVVKEIIEFARGRGIPVDVRGSAAGALVSYVLGFTRVCPIANDLYFERFMNPGRTSCPDIDVDLCWRRRDEVIRFCYEHWGDAHVAMICNIQTYRLRGAIRDAGRTLGLEPGRIDEYVRRRGESDSACIYRLARRLIGLPRHIGVHCGGLVITPSRVGSLAPLQRAAKGVVITQYDKDAAEAMGLIKMDLLGNRSLSTVAGTTALLAAQAPDIDRLEPLDERTCRMLSRGDSLGVFQCESPGMRQLLRGLKVRGRRDVAIALSLIRPGPASGGMKQAFIDRHVHGKEFTYLHPRLEQVFGNTYGVMLYQEDVMKLAVELAGYSIAEADQFRSEVSKRVDSARLHRQYTGFVYQRAPEAGIDRETAERVWDQVLQFAAYSYCKAHATVYANIAWQTAYLKAHCPTAFYTALLNNHQGMYPLRVYVWDARRHGILVRGPHVNRSDVEWTMEPDGIRAGLGIVKNLTHTAMRRILRERRRTPFRSLNDLRTRVRLSMPELVNLIRCGACDGLARSRPAMLLQAQYTPVPRGQLMLFELLPNPPVHALPDYTAVERLRAEIEILRIPFTMHPETLIRRPHILGRYLRNMQGRIVEVAGFVAAARKARTTRRKTMGFVTLEDRSELIEISFFPDRMEEYEKICTCGGPVWVRGKVTVHLSSLVLEALEAGDVELRPVTRQQPVGTDTTRSRRSAPGCPAC